MVMLKRAAHGVVDLGDIALSKRRIKKGDKFGRFGITFATDSLRVDAIDPIAPAAKTELVVGDVVTSVDGIDLTGVPLETASTLMSVSAGTAVRFGLARGVTITMVAIPR
jgi:C-terminal processing protease CtpA/Prc